MKFWKKKATERPEPTPEPMPLHAHEITENDAALIRMMAGAHFGDDSTVTLPSGKTITGVEMQRWVRNQGAPMTEMIEIAAFEIQAGHVDIADDDGVHRCFLLEATGRSTVGDTKTVRIAIDSTILNEFITMATHAANRAFPDTMNNPDPS